MSLNLEVGKRYKVSFGQGFSAYTSYVSKEDEHSYYFVDDGDDFTWSILKTYEGVVFEETTEILTGEEG